MGEIEACQNGQDLELRQDQSGATSSQDLTAEGSAIPTDSKEDDQEHLLPRQKPRATYLTAHTFEDFGGRRHFGLEDGQGGASPGEKQSWKRPIGLVLCVLLLVGCLAGVAFAVGRDRLVTPVTARELRFFVVGDWGRDGTNNQSDVAAAMGQLAATQKPRFIVSVGDNFYESGLTSVEDSQFSTSFTDVYSHPSLQVPFYTILGNHDYGELWGVGSMPQPSNCRNASSCFYSPLHQLSQRLTERDWRWHCQRSYTLSLSQGEVDLFFIDTSPGLDQYQGAVWASVPGGILSESWQAQVLELETRLAGSRASWKIVVGHHPVWNNHFNDTEELVASVQPLLERYQVQAYFSGHEHDLQWHHLDGEATHYIVSGAGSLTDYPDTYYPSARSRFLHQGSGFVTCALSLSQLKCDFMGIRQQEPLLKVTIPQKPAKPAG